jgi:hypothetical protein
MSQIKRKPLPSEKPLPQDFKDGSDSDLERVSTEIQNPPSANANEAKNTGWEGSAQPSTSPTTTTVNQTARSSFAERFNRRFPAHRRYLGMSRKIFLCVLVATIVVLLALIIGLSVGLTKRSKYVVL